MFGGTAATNEGYSTPTNNVYIFNVTHNTIVSYYYVHVQYTCQTLHVYTRYTSIYTKKGLPVYTRTKIKRGDDFHVFILTIIN